MKKLILLITALIFHHTIFAQGVGINTTTPDPSAALDIQNTDKGILIPKVALNSLTDKTTIASPANSLLIYNTNPNLAQGVGFYYNANTAASPSWKSLSDWKLPYYGAGSEPAASFLIENYHGGQNSSAIKGYSGGSGTGVHARSDGGVALKAEGGVKIFGNGQNPGVGKVLTSDAEGNAKWEGGVAFRASGVVGGGSQKIAKGVETKIPYNAVEYDLGNNYNPADVSPHSSFIVPVDGIYHFDVHGTLNNIDSETLNTAVLNLNVNRDGSVYNTLSSYSNSSYKRFEGVISIDVMLKAQDEVYVTIAHYTFDYLDLNITDEANNFSGRLVMKQ